MSVSVFTLFGELSVSTGGFTNSLRQAEARLNATQKQLADTEIAAQRLGKSTSAVTNRSFEKLNERIAESSKRLATSVSAFNQGEISSKKLSSAFTQNERAIKSVSSSLSDYSARLADSARQKTSFTTKLVASVGVATLAASAITALAAALQTGATAIFGFSARMEQTKIGFTTLMGNAQLAEKHLKALQKFAIDTPFEFEGLANASRRLQGVGVQAEKVIPLLKDVGNAAAAAGASASQLDSIVLAFSQIIAKGKLSAEEVNQLAERGIPVWKMLEQQLGRSKGEIIKLAEQGKISSELFIQAFQKFSQQKFGDAMQKQSKTFLGAMSTIKDVMTQTAATAFEPLFQKISSLAVRFSEEIQAKGNDFNAVGETIAKYIGEGLAIGLEASISAVGGFIGNRLKEIFTEGKIVSPLLKSFAEGLFKPFTDTGKLTKVIPSLTKGVTDIKNSVKQVPSLAKQLDAVEAAEKLKKLNQAVGQTIGNLILQIRFFGDESEVANTKQALLSQGITDFSKGLAQTAIQYASYLDKLKATQKATDEYNEKVKSLRDEMKTLRENASFEIQFTNPTTLNKFSDWVSKNTTGIRGLKTEIEATARELERAAKMQSFRDGLSNFNQFIEQGLTGITKGIINSTAKFSNFKTTLLDVAQTMNLAKTSFQSVGGGALGLNVTDYNFADKTQSFVNGIKKAQEELKTVLSVHDKDLFSGDWSQALADAAQNAQIKVAKQIDGMKNSFKDFLETLRTVDREGKTIPLFATRGLMDSFIDGLINLEQVVKKSELAQGIEQVAQAAENLGLKFKGINLTELEKVQKMFTDSSLTEAIKAQAAAWGLTTEKLKAYMESLAQFKDAPDTSVRPRIVDGEEQLTYWQKVAQKIKENFQSVDQTVRTSSQKMGDALTDVFSRVDSIFRGAIDSSEGFFRGILNGFKDFAKQMISEMLALLAVASIVGLIQGAFGGGGFGAGFNKGFNKTIEQNPGGGTGGSLLGGIFGGGFSDGGFTGNGGKFEPAGIVHKGEYVFSKEDIARNGGVSNVASMAKGGASGGNSYNVNVNVHGVKDAKSFMQSASQVKREMVAALQSAQLKTA